MTQKLQTSAFFIYMIVYLAAVGNSPWFHFKPQLPTNTSMIPWLWTSQTEFLLEKLRTTNKMLVSWTLHETLNLTRKPIYCKDILRYLEKIWVKKLKNQRVVKVERVKKKIVKSFDHHILINNIFYSSIVAAYVEGR